GFPKRREGTRRATKTSVGGTAPHPWRLSPTGKGENVHFPTIPRRRNSSLIQRGESATISVVLGEVHGRPVGSPIHASHADDSIRGRRLARRRLGASLRSPYRAQGRFFFQGQGYPEEGFHRR